MNYRDMKILASLARENPKHHGALCRLAATVHEQQVEKAKAMDGLDPQIAAWMATTGLLDGNKGDDVVGAAPVQMSASMLNPSQTTMVLSKAIGMALDQLKKGKVGGQLGAIISKDKHILDGHHRWAASILAAGPKAKVGGLGVALPGRELLKVLNIVSKGLFGVRNGQAGRGSIAAFRPENTRMILEEYVDKGIGGAHPMAPDKVKAILKDSFGSVEEGIDQMAANTGLISKKVPSWAPDRKQMPVIKPEQLPATSKALNQGAINWQAPFPVEEDGAAAVRLASSLPKGSPERKALLALLRSR